MSRKKYNAEEKEGIVKEAGEKGVTATARKYGIDLATVQRWKAQYERMGMEGLSYTQRNKVYTGTEKLEAVKTYLNGGLSLQQVCNQYQIYSDSQLREWIKRYNGHEELKTTKCGGGIQMTKGRSVSMAEKIEIVQFCIASGNDYAGTIMKYEVSYVQIYQWVKKYETGGVEALIDRRGKRKTDKVLSETDLLKAKVKLLEAQTRRLEMENELLKKREEIERR